MKLYSLILTDTGLSYDNHSEDFFIGILPKDRKVAAAQTIPPVKDSGSKPIVRGRTKSSAPVSLPTAVWRAINCLRMANPEMTLMILISAIMPIHTRSHRGSFTAGSTFIKHTATKTASAAVSSLSPVLLTALNFRANAPSSISESPAAI